MTDPIKSKIQELVPEVMKLKFGCEVRLLKDKSNFAHEMWKRFSANIWQYDDGKFRLVCGNGWADINLFQEFRDSWEILGSPITLAVVLLAIDKKRGGWSIGTDGRFITITEDGWAWAKESNSVLAVTWNLEHDNFDDQTPECQAFIGDLLGVTK